MPSCMRADIVLVDLEFGAGLLTFDEVCKKVERIALKEEDEIKAAHAQSQVRAAAEPYSFHV